MYQFVHTRAGLIGESAIGDRTFGSRVASEIGSQILRDALLLVVSTAEVTTATRPTTTLGTKVDDEDVVATIRRVSDELQDATGIPTWVEVKTDGQLIAYIEGFCRSSDTEGVDTVVARDLEPIVDLGDSGYQPMALTQLAMYVAVWQAAVNNYCPEHARDVREIDERFQTMLENSGQSLSLGSTSPAGPRRITARSGSGHV